MEMSFYAFAVLFVYFEVYTLIHAREIMEDQKHAIKTLDEAERTGDRSSIDINSNYLRAYLLDMLYFIWSGIGLLTSQWILFAVIFSMSIFSMMLRNRLLREASLSDNTRFARGNCCFAIALLVIIVCNKMYNWFDVPRSILEVFGLW